jgi:hypothetical protein
LGKRRNEPGCNGRAVFRKDDAIESDFTGRMNGGTFLHHPSDTVLQRDQGIFTGAPVAFEKTNVFILFFIGSAQADADIFRGKRDLLHKDLLSNDFFSEPVNRTPLLFAWINDKMLGLIQPIQD